MYGRDAILAQAKTWVRRALEGDGRLVLFAGEPGIGKSTLAEHVAAEAASEGAVIAWGRCWEAGGAPAYWPWIQVFRELGMEEDPFSGALPDLATGAHEARFAAFDWAVRALRNRASVSPLALVLDDLHAADAPSLLLLLLLARQLRGTRVLVVGAYREAEVRLQPATAQLLAKLARESELRRLERLRLEDVTAWMGEASRDGQDTAEQAAELFRWTEGHPLFVAEALRLGPRSRPLRDLRTDLGSVLDEHLGRLSATTRAVLEVGAVLGREFSATSLEETAALTPDAVHQALTEALATSIVVPIANPAASFRFSHVLLRDRLYAEILPSTRTALHVRAGTALLAQGEAALPAAAHHFFESQGAATAERVAEVALAAAESCLSRLAFEETARLTRRALGLVATTETSGSLRGRLELVLAEASIRLGEAAQGRSLCVEAATRAVRAGSPELLARAALVYGTELLSGVIDPQMVDLLRRALAALGSEDSPARARLLARLAAALTPPAGVDTLDEIVTSMRAATAMARRLGDPQTLLYVLQFGATVALLVSEQERFSVMQESVELARALKQPLVLMQILPGYITGLLGRGERAQAEAALRSYEELTAEPRQPIVRVHRALLRAMLAMLDGNFEEAERLNLEARLDAEQADCGPGIRLCLTQRLSFAVMRSEPKLLESDASRLIPHFEWMASGVPYVAWTLIGLGRRDEAVERLRTLDIAPTIVPSANLMELIGAAEACVLLGDAALGRALYPLLRRAADRMFWAFAPGALIGPTARTLGDLASFIGLPNDALVHYEAAIAFCEKLGAPPLAAICRRSRERTLAESSAPATSLASATSSVGSSLVPTQHSYADGVRVALRREGDVWSVISWSGAPVRLKHSKGLGYLGYLLEQPGRQVHVLELVGVDAQPGDAGELLDARAKAEYRERLDALRDQLAEAEAFGDVARASRLEAEIESLADQLAGAVGLGGRDRRAASVVERTRINVQRCLKDALSRIAAADPPLGRYLSAAVKSGTYCSYLPL